MASEETLFDYWDGAEKQARIRKDDLAPWLKDNRVLKVPNFKTRAVPLSVHIDAGPYAQRGSKQQQSVDVMTWSSEVGEGWCTEVPARSSCVSITQLCGRELRSVKMYFQKNAFTFPGPPRIASLSKRRPLWLRTPQHAGCARNAYIYIYIIYR